MRKLVVHADWVSIDGNYCQVEGGELRAQLVGDLDVDKDLREARERLGLVEERHKLELARLELRIQRLERVPWWRRIRRRIAP